MKFTPSEVIEFRLKYEAGATIAELAKEYSASTETIRRAVAGHRPYSHVPNAVKVRRPGPPRGTPRPSIQRFDRRHAIALRNHGHSLREIGEILGVSHEAIRQAIKDSA